MGELLTYAENFYRRFPEEFIALGAPGLEEIFDLRSHGTRSRRISESPTEKTVEITIRRWQAPALMPPAPSLPLFGGGSFQAAGCPYPYNHNHSSLQAFNHDLQGLQGSCAGPPALARPGWSQDLLAQQAAAMGVALPSSAIGVTLPSSFASFAPQGPSPAPPVPQPPAPTHLQQSQPAQQHPNSLNSSEATFVNAQLARLESALELLKPQIEAAITAKAAPALPTSPSLSLRAPAPAAAHAAAAASHSEQPARLHSSSSCHNLAGANSDASPESPLRERRKLAGLTIVKPTALQDTSKGAILKDVPVKEIPKATPDEKVVPEPKPQLQIQISDSGNGEQHGASGKAASSSAPAVQTAQVIVVEPEENHRRGSKEQNRPRAISTTRVANSPTDPESPRSPGKYSAWK